ncbi:MAG TPA: Dps family protein [Sphingomonadales bacterium]|nr:Dps family protein [Sphingomonadales bacterium]
MDINIGIKKSDRKAVAAGLSRLLADTYTLYFKTHNYHWNVRGPMFQTLHLLFETQYNELWMAGDLIAERIRALGEFAPGSYAAYAKLTSLGTEGDDGFLPAEKMLENLVRGHEAVVKTARGVMPVAEKAGDDVSIDLLTQRMEVSEKAAWMLRSLLG